MRKSINSTVSVVFRWSICITIDFPYHSEDGFLIFVFTCVHSRAHHISEFRPTNTIQKDFSRFSRPFTDQTCIQLPFRFQLKWLPHDPEPISSNIPPLLRIPEPFNCLSMKSQIQHPSRSSLCKSDARRMLIRTPITAHHTQCGIIFFWAPVQFATTFQNTSLKIRKDWGNIVRDGNTFVAQVCGIVLAWHLILLMAFNVFNFCERFYSLVGKIGLWKSFKEMKHNNFLWLISADSNSLFIESWILMAKLWFYVVQWFAI
jgi:hypothetical protein